MSVRGGIGAVVATPWYPLIKEGIYIDEWIIQPFYFIHLRSSSTL